MADDKPEDMAKRYYRRACCMRKTARRNSLGIIGLFFSTLVAVWGASEIMLLMDIEAGENASTATEEQLEKQIQIEEQIVEVRLRRRHDFNGIAIMRDGKTAAVAGDRGLIMISKGKRHSWVKAPSNTGRSVYGVALSDNGETAVAVGRHGLVRFSADGGETWKNPGDLVGKEKDSSGVALSGDGMIAVAVGDDGLVWISRDGGATWGNPVNITEEDIIMEEDIHGVLR